MIMGAPCGLDNSERAADTTIPRMRPALRRHWPQELPVCRLRCRRCRAAAIYSLIESAKPNGLNPQHHLADVPPRIAYHPARRIAELLPWNRQPLDAARAAA
jgi:hypothetical protein